MKTRTILVIACALTLNASLASAACTQQEAQQKAQQLATQLQALAQKDTARFTQLTQEFQQKAASLATATDMDAVCKYYDDMIAKSK